VPGGARMGLAAHAGAAEAADADADADAAAVGEPATPPKGRFRARQAFGREPLEAAEAARWQPGVNRLREVRQRALKQQLTLYSDSDRFYSGPLKNN
jgi:hypothetical protein